MRLFNLTGEESYLEKAREIYHWSRENLLDPESGRVADHISAGGNIGYEDYTYNQGTAIGARSEEHTFELQSRGHIVCRLLLVKKKKRRRITARGPGT